VVQGQGHLAHLGWRLLACGERRTANESDGIALHGAGEALRVRSGLAGRSLRRHATHGHCAGS